MKEKRRRKEPENRENQMTLGKATIDPEYLFHFTFIFFLFFLF